jgi:hypothetical protein
LREGSWYLANVTSPITTRSLTQAVNFYAVPSVKEIIDQAGLVAVRNALSGKYILFNNIALSDNGAGFESASGWLPIGNLSKWLYRHL